MISPVRLPRKIPYWTDDLQLLLGFVRSGQALAYLPDFALEDPQPVRIRVSDCACECSERAWLVWNRHARPARLLLPLFLQGADRRFPVVDRLDPAHDLGTPRFVGIRVNGAVDVEQQQTQQVILLGAAQQLDLFSDLGNEGRHWQAPYC
jgi:hypothetical protein